MLSASVHALKRFLVKQACHTVLICLFLQHIHDDQILIHRNIGIDKQRCDFKLTGSYLVVLGLCIDSKLPQLLIHLCHEGLYTGRDASKVMTANIHALWRHGTKQRASGMHQILTLQIHPFINQKVFLLQTDHGIDMLDILIFKQIDNAGGLLADRFR